MTKDNYFIYQYSFNGDQTAKNLGSQTPEKLQDSNATLWQHIDLENVKAKSWLEKSANLDTIVFESLTAEESRPRSFAVKDGLMVVLRGVNLNPGDNPEDMVSVRLWVQKNRVISSRRRKIISINDLVQNCDKQQAPRTSGEFLTSLIDNLADRIGDFVNRIEEDMGEAEDSLETTEPAQLRSTLGSLRRQIASVRRFLAPQRDALDRLNNIETDILSARDRQRLREESDRVSRYLEDLDLARERAVVLQEAFLSQLAQEQNTRMYVLSIISAVFLPLTFVTGLLGMNVGGLPGIDNSKGFLIATVIMLSATLGLVVYFKKKKWM